jgi:L-threonylcarbamoyladenylate synthase
MSPVDRAVEVLRSGGLVAFPTETVYGLGADATSARAIRRIFEAKGRPPANPLIVHVADESTAQRYAADWPEAATRLARRFWPGALTLVLPKRRVIVDEATAGLPTVGLRCPNHPLALELLRRFAGPLAAPSANRSTRISPTTAQHVRDELGDAVDLVLDGGRCPVGIESTVLDLAGLTPVILRPGAVTAEMIEGEIGQVGHFSGVREVGQPAASPGQQEIHYSPLTPAYRYEAADLPRAKRWMNGRTGPMAWLTLSTMTAGHTGPALPMPADPAEYARMLYSTLRDLDRLGLSGILIEMPPALPEWVAVRDRLCRAARPLAEEL